MRAAVLQNELMPAGLPAGRRVPRGRMRWYLVHTPEGMERTTCNKLLQIIPKSLLRDAFVLSKERWIKRAGSWSIQVSQMYPEYFFAVTDDVQGLNNALQKLSFHVDLVGAHERACMPLAGDARTFFEHAVGDGHLIRGSVGVLEDGVLRVTKGPLVGQEDRVVKIDRHKRRCWVRIGEPGNGFLETLALDIPPEVRQTDALSCK